MCALVTGVQTCARPISEARGRCTLGAVVARPRPCPTRRQQGRAPGPRPRPRAAGRRRARGDARQHLPAVDRPGCSRALAELLREDGVAVACLRPHRPVIDRPAGRSDEHTSELKSLMRISYAVFCLKKKKTTIT